MLRRATLAICLGFEPNWPGPVSLSPELKVGGSGRLCARRERELVEYLDT